MAKTMMVEYSSNNSGGGWWLKDKDWFALEKAGWTVAWIKDEKPLKMGGKTYTFGMGDKDGRWLGALASARHTLLWPNFTPYSFSSSLVSCR